MTRDEITSQARAGGGMFAVIPAVVMRDSELSMSARMLYGIITWRCNENACCWPTNRTLGEELGLSAKRVSALLSLLEARGHIEMETLYDEAGQVLRRNIYPIMRSSRSIEAQQGRGIHKYEDTPTQNQGYPLPEPGDTPTQSQGDPLPKNEAELYKEKEETKRETEIDPPKAPQGGLPAPKPTRRRRAAKSVPEWKPERFERFWKFYPLHTDRVSAVREWDRLKPSDELINQIARALLWQTKVPDWPAPYACRYLKNQRWTDEPPKGKGQETGRPAARQLTGWHIEVIDGEEVMVPDGNQ